MLVSPSVASGDTLRLGDEIAWVGEHFDAVHLDVADGMAVPEITFGFDVAREACRRLPALNRSLHLELIDPLRHAPEVRACGADVVHIQVDVLNNPEDTVRRFFEGGLAVGVCLNANDMDAPYVGELLGLVTSVLVDTTAMRGPLTYDPLMVAFAERVKEEGMAEVWVDGGIDAAKCLELTDGRIDGVVLGRAVFKDRERAVELFGRRAR